jgi:hypothetical protein
MAVVDGSVSLSLIMGGENAFTTIDRQTQPLIVQIVIQQGMGDVLKCSLPSINQCEYYLYFFALISILLSCGKHLDMKITSMLDVNISQLKHRNILHAPFVEPFDFYDPSC